MVFALVQFVFFVASVLRPPNAFTLIFAASDDGKANSPRVRVFERERGKEKTHTKKMEEKR